MSAFNYMKGEAMSGGWRMRYISRIRQAKRSIPTIWFGNCGKEIGRGGFYWYHASRCAVQDKFGLRRMDFIRLMYSLKWGDGDRRA